MPLKSKHPTTLLQGTRSQQIVLIVGMTLLMWGLNLSLQLIVSDLKGQPFALWMWLKANAFLLPLTWIIAKVMNKLPVILVLAAGPFIALLISFIDFQLYAQIYARSFSWKAPDFYLPEFLTDVYLYSLFYFAWYLAYTAIHNYFRFLHQSLAALEAKSQADAAQLAMLRYQINPHFLFNTLNSISALVLSEKNESAETMISSLSRFLRSSLDNRSDVLVPLSQELDVTREYLQIEKIRFEDRLEYEFEVEAPALEYLVPGFILQPAVENAIKHAVAPSKNKIHLKLYASVSDKNLVFGIRDTGPGLAGGINGNGIGLANMRSRLQVIYKGEADVALKNNLDHGATVEFKLPKRITHEI